MPYINRDRRGKAIFSPENAGELNYAITILLDNYVGKKGRDYQTLNDILGALEGAKLEFYRRMVVPLEELKMKVNGDVYITRTGE